MNPWKRKGLFYYATYDFYTGGGIFVCKSKKKLDIVSYHVIKWWHGEEKLRSMALNTAFKDIFGG